MSVKFAGNSAHINPIAFLARNNLTIPWLTLLEFDGHVFDVTEFMSVFYGCRLAWEAEVLSSGEPLCGRGKKNV